MYKRLLYEKIRNSPKSVLLLGPRQTGKSTLIQSLKPDLEINLAHEGTFLQFAQNPFELEERILNHETIFIDEIQKLPKLTNTLQTLLDRNKKLKVFMTGSSARKLRRSHANLLPGRIFSFEMTSLNYLEIGENIDLQKALSTGLLPEIYSEGDVSFCQQMATQYAGIYLKEEIAAEGYAKNIEGFARFLGYLAASNGDILELSKTANKAQISRAAATRFFEILEDTLLIHRCPAFAKSEKSRLVQHPRFYFFDAGVVNGLLGNFAVSEDRKGQLFESFIFNQIYSVLKSKSENFRISYYRTEAGAEVDFILERDHHLFAIEVKASKNIGPSDLKGFQSFENFYQKKFNRLVLYLGESEKKINQVDIFPWKKGLEIILT